MDVLAADQCVFLAGAVAYQFFFAIIPLMALTIGVLGFIYGPERAIDEVSAALRQVYPASGREELAVVRQLSEGRGLAIGLGLLGTVVTVTTIHGALDASLDVVLGRAKERTFVRGKLEAFAFAAGLLLMAIPSVVLSAGVEALRGPISTITAFVFFFLTYRVVPRVAVGPRAAAIGALVATILWEVAKLLFGAYTQFLGAFAAYGSLAFVAGVLTWIYLTALIILLGAEAVKLARSR